LVTELVPALEDGQALVRTLFLSPDPTNRIWLSDAQGYLPPIEIDSVVRGLGIGEVIASRRADLPIGSLVNGFLGWQELCLVDDGQMLAPLTLLPDPLPAPLPAFLGVLGHTGITAYFGLEISQLRAGETIVVSAACGAVGSVVGQIAKARGARPIGIAGGAEKCRYAVEVLGYDACVDYRAAGWEEQLDEATRDGVDVDFENVGGPIMDHVLTRLNRGARIALCGLISQYGPPTGEVRMGQQNLVQLINRRATMTGFLITDFVERYGEAVDHLADMLARGSLRGEETIVDGGLDSLPGALSELFAGGNVGKLLVRIADPPDRPSLCPPDRSPGAGRTSGASLG
jgi:NADPH-dependent curcumin reductase CurA